LHEFEASIYKALKGIALAGDCKPLIARQRRTSEMDALGLPASGELAHGVNNFEKNNKKPSVTNCCFIF
jgi:hypothetical protein